MGQQAVSNLFSHTNAIPFTRLFCLYLHCPSWHVIAVVLRRASIAAIQAYAIIEVTKHKALPWESLESARNIALLWHRYQDFL
jgi:hypothetical protein